MVFSMVLSGLLEEVLFSKQLKSQISIQDNIDMVLTYLRTCILLPYNLLSRYPMSTSLMDG